MIQKNKIKNSYKIKNSVIENFEQKYIQVITINAGLHWEVCTLTYTSGNTRVESFKNIERVVSSVTKSLIEKIGLRLEIGYIIH